MIGESQLSQLAHSLSLHKDSFIYESYNNDYTDPHA